MLLVAVDAVFASEFNSDAMRAARTSGVKDSQICATEVGITDDASPARDLLCIDGSSDE